jgi:hypothetical protein
MVYGIDLGKKLLSVPGLPVVEPEIKVYPQFLFDVAVAVGLPLFVGQAAQTLLEETFASPPSKLQTKEGEKTFCYPSTATSNRPSAHTNSLTIRLLHMHGANGSNNSHC